MSEAKACFRHQEGCTEEKQANSNTNLSCLLRPQKAGDSEHESRERERIHLHVVSSRNDTQRYSEQEVQYTS